MTMLLISLQLLQTDNSKCCLKLDVGGEQFINVPTALKQANYDEIKRFFMHAFCNAAGMFNEQQRKDRDDYVVVNLNNVKDNCKSAFAKITQNYTMQGAFDMSSITLAASKDYS